MAICSRRSFSINCTPRSLSWGSRTTCQLNLPFKIILLYARKMGSREIVVDEQKGTSPLLLWQFENKMILEFSDAVFHQFPTSTRVSSTCQLSLLFGVHLSWECLKVSRRPATPRHVGQILVRFCWRSSSAVSHPYPSEPAASRTLTAAGSRSVSNFAPRSCLVPAMRNNRDDNTYATWPTSTTPGSVAMSWRWRSSNPISWTGGRWLPSN